MEASSLINRLERLSLPSITNEERLETFQACEAYKINSFSLKDFDLFFKQLTHINVKRFGLQCLDYQIRQSWYSINPEDRLAIKSCLFSVISNVGKSSNQLSSSEENILLVPISEILVHMILCEWPQNWPSLMSELLDLAKQGSFETKVVLASLLRLSQDVMQYDNVPGRRKRDIVSSLHNNMNAIFDFCLSTTLDNVAKCQPVSLSLCKEAVTTLIGFLDWVKMDYVHQQDGLLFQLLVKLLPGHLVNSSTDSIIAPQISTKALEAMLVALSRRDKLDIRQPLLVILEKDTIFLPLLDCTRHLASLPTTLSQMSEAEFDFINRLCAVMVSLGCLCLAAWTDRYKHSKPPNWPLLLECIFYFTQHPSVLIALETSEFWISLFSQESDFILSEARPLIELLHPIWLKALLKKQTDTFTPQLLEMDDQCTVNARLRAVTCRCLHVSSKTCFNESLQVLMNKVNDFVNLVKNSNDIHQPLVQGEGTVLYVDTVLKSGSLVDDNQSSRADILERYQSQGNEHLQSILCCISVYSNQQQSTSSPEVLQLLANLIDLSRCFLGFGRGNFQQVLPDYLTRLFTPMQWSLENIPLEHKNYLSKLHLNCGANFLRAIQVYPQYFIAFFDDLSTFVRNVVVNGAIGWVQRSLLLQGLVTLSAEFKNYDKQRQVIEDLYRLYIDPWHDNQLQTAVANTEKFFYFIGLLEPDNDATAQQYQQRRNIIISSIYALLFCLRSSQIPTDEKEAEQGGFYHFINGKRLLRNPVTPCVMPILPHFFYLMNCLIVLNSEHCVDLVHPNYRSAFQLSKQMKLIILGKAPSDETTLKKETKGDKTDQSLNLKTMNSLSKFITGAFEHLSQFLGFACAVIGEEMYMVPNFGTLVLRDTALRHVQTLKNYKFHLIYKYLLRLLILHCPTEYYEMVLIPLIPHIVSSTFNKLESNWKTYATRKHKPSATNADEDDSDESDELSDEVIEEHCTRILTRSFIDLIKIILTSSKNCPVKTTNGCDAKSSLITDDTEMTDNTQEDKATTTTSNGTETADTQLGELGCLICRSSRLQQQQQQSSTCDATMPCATLLLGVLTQSITWPDTLVCHRATPLIAPLLAEMRKSCAELVTEEMIIQVFHILLQSLTINGQHRDCTLPFLLNSIINVYESYRPVIPRLSDILEAATSTKKSVITAFENKLIDKTKQLNDRNKRDSIRKIVEPLIGVPLSEQYKERIKIMNLPALAKVKWSTTSSDLLDRDYLPSDSQDVVGLCSLFGDA